MSIKVSNFGETEDGQEIKLFTLTNSNGMIAKLTNYGAILISLFVPDKNKNLVDVVLGFDKIEDYFINHCYFGSTIGRNSNRIKNSTFKLNNILYSLDKNERENNLHSGFNCYNKRLWDAKFDEKTCSVFFHILSPDGDQGFPGNFDITVKYTLTDDNSLGIHYEGVSDKDTIANMTNHSYFNLDGCNNETAINQKLWINSDKFVAVDEELIPTGKLENVFGTPMDFSALKLIGKEINNNFQQLVFTGGYDHSYLLNKKSNGIEKQAMLMSQKTGIAMEVYTDCIGIQFYSGNFIDDIPQIGKNGMIYEKRSGICLETGFLPDSINQKNFVSPILKAREKYNTTTIYKFL